jgi:hypothetical protein
MSYACKRAIWPLPPPRSNELSTCHIPVSPQTVPERRGLKYKTRFFRYSLHSCALSFCQKADFKRLVGPFHVLPIFRVLSKQGAVAIMLSLGMRINHFFIWISDSEDVVPVCSFAR